MSTEIKCNSPGGIKILRDLKKMPSSFMQEEIEREKRLSEEIANREKKKKSVLKRIEKQARSLQKTTYVDYKDPKEVKKELNSLLRDDDNIEVNEDFLPSRGGRPVIDQELKAKKIMVSLDAHLHNEIEGRRASADSRSQVLGDLLEKGLKYERLRRAQANTLKRYLKEFARMFSQIRIKNGSAIWREREIVFKDNKVVLAQLYKKSLEISNYLDSTEIDRGKFSDIKNHLTDKEIRYLEFASDPEKIANVVKMDDEQIEDRVDG